MSTPRQQGALAHPDTWGDVDARRLHARVLGRLFGEPAAPVTIGRFRVERHLGAGAMGVVYAAVDEQLGRRVAIKLLHPHLQGDDQGRARLLREARAMARLEHEHVARVYEVGAWGDQVYIAMELIEGVTLDTWLRERPRPWQLVLGVYLQAGRALAAAHHAGLLHRDFKPENVIVDASGRARVLDFGLTCALDSGESLDDELAPLTRTGSILGTPAYMAPEQQRYGAAEPRSDQFSYCVALFEGLFGLLPFGAAPRLGAAEIAPIPRDSRVPARVRRAIARGLADRPDARWPTMDDLLVALQPPRRAPPIALIGAGLGGAAIAAIVTFAVVGRQQSAPAADQPRIAAEHLDALEPAPVGDDSQARALRVRDGAATVLATDPTTAVLLLRELDDPGVLAARALAVPISSAVLADHSGPVLRVRWREGQIETVDGAGRRRFRPDGAALTGPDADVREDMSSATAAIASPDGAQLATPGSHGVLVTGRGRPVTLGAQGAAVTALGWSPDSRELAVGRDDGALELWALTGKPRRLASFTTAGGVTSLAFGTGWIAAGSDDGSARVWHLGDRTASFVLRGHRGPVRAIAFEPAGLRLVTGSDDGTARVWRLTPATVVEHDLGGPVNALAWSPDGRTLAAAGDRGVGVWLLPAAGGAGEPRPHDGTIFALAWSPDGRELAIADDRGEVTRLARNEHGEGVPRLVDRQGSVLALAWDPRTARLAAGGLDETLTTWPSGQGEPTRAALRHGNIEALAWSPVDDRLAVATASGVIALVQGDATNFRDLGHVLGDLAWSPRGDLLALVGEGRALLRVAVAAGTLGEFGRAPVPLWSVAWDPRDRFVVAGGADGALYFWPRDLDARPDVLAAHGDAVHALAYDPAGERLASAGADGRVLIWPRLDGDLRERLLAATTACLDLEARRRHLGEPADVAAMRVAACREHRGP